MTDIQRIPFLCPDGTELAIHELGEGRPLLLIHGLFSSAAMNWIKFGHAAKLAAAGFKVVMPDLRVHGQSAAPHDPAFYPEDILVDDMLALLDHYAWNDFDLGGFSLGARTTAKLLTHGIKPRKAILMGMGWEGLNGWGSRLQFFIDAIDKRDTTKRGDPHFMAVSFMKSQKIDPVAARLLLQSFGPMDVEALTDIDMPMAVICGSEDEDNGSAPRLAQELSDARYFEIPGTHMSSVTEAALSEAMIHFLGEDE